MDLEAFSTRWFTLYFILLGFLFIGTGLYLIIKNERFTAYIRIKTQFKKPPLLFIRILKYFFLFTLPGLFLSFFPFSWVELLSSIWSLILVYLAGIQLVQWKQNRLFIRDHITKLPAHIRRYGAITVAVGFALFLLAYVVLLKNSPG